jgi:hypothetical protein
VAALSALAIVCVYVVYRTDTSSVLYASPRPSAPVEVCFSVDLSNVRSMRTLSADEKPVSCEQSHDLETVATGSFAGAAYPVEGDVGTEEAYAHCTTAADAFLGGDWQTAYTWLVLSVPTAQSWSTGARGYRCDLAPTKDVTGENEISVKVSLRDGLRNGAPLAITCLSLHTDDDNVVTDSGAADCGLPHDGEFAGLFALSQGTPYDHDVATAEADAACGRLVKAYVGFSGDASNDLGYTSWEPGSATIDLDNRYPCVIWVAGKKLLGSVKGIGDATPDFAYP